MQRITQRSVSVVTKRSSGSCAQIDRIFFTRKGGATSSRSATSVPRKQALPMCPPTNPRDMAPNARQVSALPPTPIPRPLWAPPTTVQLLKTRGANDHRSYHGISTRPRAGRAISARAGGCVCVRACAPLRSPRRRASRRRVPSCYVWLPPPRGQAWLSP